MAVRRRIQLRLQMVSSALAELLARYSSCGWLSSLGGREISSLDASCLSWVVSCKEEPRRWRMLSIFFAIFAFESLGSAVEDYPAIGWLHG